MEQGRVSARPCTPMSKITFQNRPGVHVTVESDGHTTQVWNTYAIPTKALDRNADLRKLNRRAPLGDSHGAYQHVAELPLALVLSQIPPELWEDEKEWKKLLNSGEYRFFRVDGDHRTF